MIDQMTLWLEVINFVAQFQPTIKNNGKTPSAPLGVKELKE